MTSSTRHPAPRPVPGRAPRTIGVLLAVLLTVVGFGALSGSAGASTRHTVHRTATRQVHARVARTATVTAHATVRGRTVAITTTAKAIGRATAKATGRASATAASRTVARAQAQHRAVALAKARAHRMAVARAARRATASARQKARALASARAERAAETLAGRTGGAKTSTPPTSGTSSGAGAGTSTGTTAPGSGAGSTGTSCGSEIPVKADGTPWICTFDDEFDGTSLDTGRWLVQQTANSGFAQAGACYTDSPDTISVTGGTLNLSVNKSDTPVSCPSPKGAFTTNYTAGEVTTLGTFSQTYGRYEVRAQLPATTTAGLQETFWLWPNTQTIYGPWPASGEIDFAEFYSQYAGWVIPYLHYTYDTGTSSWATNTNVVTAWPAPYNQPGMNCTINQAGYNTYTFTWHPNLLTIQVNGQNCLIDHYQSSLSGTAPFDQPFFLALTQAIGLGTNAPTTATPFPATTHVDYVRVWK